MQAAMDSILICTLIYNSSSVDFVFCNVMLEISSLNSRYDF